MFQDSRFDPFEQVEAGLPALEQRRRREELAAHRDVLAKLCIKLLKGEAEFARSDGDPDLPERAQRRMQTGESRPQLREMIEALGRNPDEL